jgi:hypothetical protein
VRTLPSAEDPIPIAEELQSDRKSTNRKLELKTRMQQQPTAFSVHQIWQQNVYD